MRQLLNLENARKTMQAYEKMTRPLCARLGIPQNAFDILMFLANNPARNTAREIVELRGLKANVVSVNVERLVREGYLERGADPEDRRKTILTCTQKAQPIVEQGRRLQARFGQRLLEGVPPQSLQVMAQVFEKISSNIDEMWSDEEWNNCF